MRPKVNMDLTSMSDLTFLLLITFIITFPIIEQGVPIKLPKGKSSEMDPQQQTSTVTVDKEGRVFLGDGIVELDALKERLQSRVAENPELKLIIRGDIDANYGKVAEVARLANELGITRMALATQGGEGGS